MAKLNDLLVLGNSSLIGDVNIKNTLSADTLKILSTGGLPHLEFARANYNYIKAPTAGTLAFVVNDSSDNMATNAQLTINKDGVTVKALNGLTSTELSYLDGVTSSIQTQLNGKAPSSHNHSAANITSGTLPIARGGTGATVAPNARVNLLSLDNNPITKVADDTVAKWGAYGPGATAFYTATGQLTDQPSQWGFIHNIMTSTGSEVHQIWATQSSGDMYHRGGNSSGWSGTWRKLLDSTNYNSYAPKLDGTGASGTWGISITGNAATATSASSVTWNGVSGKPSSYPPSSHNHDFITYKDTRALNESPDDVQAGLTVHLKTTGKDGLSDGGSYHALLSVKDWGDYSGGPYWQSTVTANNNMHFRRSTAGTTWGAWQKVLSDNNYTDYTVTKTGTGASGTWGIGITGNAATASKLTTNAGSTTIPVYFSGGVPKECTMITKGAWHGGLTSVGGDGVMEVGRYIDFHVNKTGESDNDVRITADTTGLTITGTTSGAFKGSLDGNASSATTANQLASNNRMEYGWDGLNYFNLSGTAGNAAKKNDTPTSAWWHILRFNHANSSGYYTDLAVPFNANSLYYKRVTSGTVQNSGWVKVLDALNYNSYAPKLDGTGAKGTWGISITGNAATASGVTWNGVSGKPSSYPPSSHSHSYIDAKGNYTFDSSTLPNSFDLGVSAGFVNSNSGYGNYGSVLTVRTYSGGGGTLQLYAPYSPTYGGSRLKARFGNYDSSSGNSWTTLKELAWVEDLTWNNISGKPNYAGSSSAGGPANSANLLNLNHGSKSSTASTAMSSWNGGVSGMKYVWGQSFFDSSIGSDSGDLVFGLRAGQYTSGGTELCLMLDGDYYSMGNKVLHAGNYGDYASAKNHNHNSTYVTLSTNQTISGTKTMTGSLKVSGRYASSGDDEGIIVGFANNGYAGLCLGGPSEARSVFYFKSDGTAPFWRYNNGSASYDISHPSKSGTVALTSDIPTTMTWNSVTGKPSEFPPSSHTHSYLPLSGGNMTGHIYLTGAQANSSTGNTSQIIFGTSANNHVAVSSNNNALIINPTHNSTNNQIVLYLDQASVFPSGVTTSKFVATNYGSAAPTSSTTGAYAAGTLYFQTV